LGVWGGYGVGQGEDGPQLFDERSVAVRGGRRGRDHRRQEGIKRRTDEVGGLEKTY
jgi:hypothetical protein